MTLRSKLASGIILMIGASVLSLAFLSFRFIRKAVQEDLESKGATMARQFSSHYADSILGREEAKLLAALLDLAKDPVVSYGMVLDPQGKVIAHTDLNKVGSLVPEFILKGEGADYPVFSRQGEKENPVLKVSFIARSRPKPATGENFFMQPEEPEAPPFKPEKAIGTVCLGLSMKAMLGFVNNIKRALLLFLMGTMGLAFFFSLLFALLITRPLGKLMEAIEQIRGGNLRYRVQILSRDEVGQVGQAFNEMTGDLQVAQEELKKKIDALGNAYQELQDTQEKIVRSEKLAAIGKLASGVGHELRNPLGAIQNAVYYVKDCLKGSAFSAQDPSIEEFLGIAEKEIKTANYIIKDLLDFARIPALERVPTDLNELIRELKGSVDIPSGVRWSEALAPKLPLVSVDTVRMRQVFINLAVNAVQAMPNGGNLSVSTYVDQASSNGILWIHARFEDTGVGIAPEDLKKLFEPLHTTKAKGTGLGLPISLGIVERHGGKIDVVSEPGKGSAFIVKLPASVNNAS